jgi:hypothetical protein
MQQEKKRLEEERLRREREERTRESRRMTGRLLKGHSSSASLQTDPEHGWPIFDYSNPDEVRHHQVLLLHSCNSNKLLSLYCRQFKQRRLSTSGIRLMLNINL